MVRIWCHLKQDMKSYAMDSTRSLPPFLPPFLPLAKSSPPHIAVAPLAGKSCVACRMQDRSGVTAANVQLESR
ncbi:hypothetical protein E2C01_046736 [Portunus trituberculatus]|uniref:Uncharacterized protein n=1 Tax=Portunus trituberculatus TaxID=210409 RepID=A0A5B7G5J2_PORTR|nr:hypothetical protein [Portunus trituberculatus]